MVGASRCRGGGLSWGLASDEYDKREERARLTTLFEPEAEAWVEDDEVEADMVNDELYVWELTMLVRYVAQLCENDRKGCTNNARTVESLQQVSEGLVGKRRGRRILGGSYSHLCSLERVQHSHGKT